MLIPRLANYRATSLRPSSHAQVINLGHSRFFSLKFARSRFASAMAAAKLTVPSIQQAPSSVSYPPNVLPPSHLKRQFEAEQDLEKATTGTVLPVANFDEKRVAVGWNTNTWSRYHNVWLRDHCRCHECFHPITKQRLVDTFEISEFIQPSEVTATNINLEVVWHGVTPHKSLYPWPWLWRNSYDPHFPEKTAEPSAPTAGTHEKVLWGSRIQQDPPTVQFEDIMTADHGLFKWLDKIDRFGFCFVTGVPVVPGDTERLARRIAHIRETQYGGFWDFTADLQHGDTAYTNIALKAHTDTTYFTDPCGLQIFHLLSHTEGSGGQTLLVDGFYVASLLSTLEPEVYSLLSKVPIPSHSAGISADSLDMAYLYQPKPKVGYPILNHDATTGDLIQVRYNNDDRSVMCHLEPGMVEPWYRALRSWNKALSSPDSEYWVQLAPGTALVVDNQRVLHGRSSFTGERRMCGAYINMDDFLSKLKVLRAQYGEGTDMPKKSIRGTVWDPAF